MSEKPRLFYEFGPFRLDEAGRRLLRDGEEVLLRENGKRERLPPKAFDLLLFLVKSGGDAIKRDELLDKLWPDTYGSDHQLTNNVSTLRKYLGDQPSGARYIETMPKHGYRFAADVREVRDETVALVEHTKAHIVIEEVREPPPAVAPDSDGHDLREHLIAPALPPAGKSRRRLNPLVIALACALVGAAALAAYFALRSKPEQAAAQAPLARSIAVLPFKPLVSASDDPALELGMTDALIAKLSNIRQVAVRPTSSVMKYTGAGLDLRAVGAELGVEMLLDGTVQKAGDRIRLSVQLVRVSDGTPIWADKFDKEFTDIFAVQDEISEKVVSKLALRLSGEEREAVAKRYTENAEAYQLYLKGLYNWRTFSRNGLLTSLNYYNAAIEKDPDFALAYSGLANAYSVIGIYGPLPVAEAMEKARGAAQKALALDEEVAEAHVALGVVKMLYDRDWQGAEVEFRRAILLAPGSPDGHNLYGYYLQAAGRHDEAIEEMQRAAELAPQWAVVVRDALESYYIARRYDEAIARCLEAQRLEPDDPFFSWILGRSYTQKGMYEEAATEFKRGLKAIEDSGLARTRPEGTARVWLLSGLGYVHAVAGRKDEALKVVGQIRESPSRRKNLYLAMVFAGLGDKEQAFAVLEESYRARLAFLWEVKSLPEFDPLRSDPRYTDLLRRMNLSP